MELYPIQASAWPLFPPAQYFFPAYAAAVPENYVNWTQTPESHIYTARLPGVTKEEIRVELEDARYLVIRTDDEDGAGGRRRRFMRKFRLPQRVDVDSISAGYEGGVLTVTVPRSFVRGRLRITAGDLPDERNFVARAA